MTGTDAVFASSTPSTYHRYLGPTLFKPYGTDLARRVKGFSPQKVLETAAGTGIATTELIRILPSTVELVATDVNQGMVDLGSSLVSAPNLTWQKADALALPFEDTAFDTVACQFGVMFFPDRTAGYREAWRVLASNGRFIFSVWDRLEANEFALLIHNTVAACFPTDPPSFLARTPYGHHDTQAILNELGEAGFHRTDVETVPLRGAALSYRDPAVGLCQGSPLKKEIESRGSLDIAEVTDRAAEALADRYGRGPIEVDLRAHVVTAFR
jgi:ubiquinone/menaquinone biosynthesis C-methylase UbiE